MTIPQKITLDKTEYENTKDAGKIIDLIYKSNMIISPYYSNESQKNNAHKQED